MEETSTNCPVEHQFPIQVISTDVIEGALHEGDAEPLHPVRKPDTDFAAFGEQDSQRAFRLKCHTAIGISTIVLA
jgi:hypothetical protein